MSRLGMILRIWAYGMNNPNFHIDDLSDELRKKRKFLRKENLYTEEDISFGLAFVKKNFYKNQDLDEYLIDQDSIANLMSLWQWVLSFTSLIVASFTLGVASWTLYVTMHINKDSSKTEQIELNEKKEPEGLLEGTEMVVIDPVDTVATDLQSSPFD